MKTAEISGWAHHTSRVSLHRALHNSGTQTVHLIVIINGYVLLSSSAIPGTVPMLNIYYPTLLSPQTLCLKNTSIAQVRKQRKRDLPEIISKQ